MFELRNGRALSCRENGRVWAVVEKPTWVMGRLRVGTCEETVTEKINLAPEIPKIDLSISFIMQAYMTFSACI